MSGRLVNKFVKNVNLNCAHDFLLTDSKSSPVIFSKTTKHQEKLQLSKVPTFKTYPCIFASG